MSALSMALRGVLQLAWVGSLGLIGCAEMLPLDSPVASGVNQQRAARAGLRPVSLGEFMPAEGTEEPLALQAKYLRDTLGVELKAAGLLDDASSHVLAAHLTDSQMRSGQGSLAARFTVTDARSGALRYERELRVGATWAPAIGNVGTQWTAKEHMALYRQLVGRLFEDPAFRDATRS